MLVANRSGWGKPIPDILTFGQLTCVDLSRWKDWQKRRSSFYERLPKDETTLRKLLVVPPKLRPCMLTYI